MEINELVKLHLILAQIFGVFIVFSLTKSEDIFSVFHFVLTVFELRLRCFNLTSLPGLILRFHRESVSLRLYPLFTINPKLIEDMFKNI